MPDTFIKIASVTVGAGGSSTIDFTSIPSTYTDLCVKLSARNTNAGYNDVRLRFNSNTSSTYSIRSIQGDGSSASSATETAQTSNWLGNTDNTTASTFSSIDLYVPNYTSSNAKSISLDNTSEANATNTRMQMIAGLWNPSPQAAITAVNLFFSSGSFAQYSTATLYGIKNS